MARPPNNEHHPQLLTASTHLASSILGHVLAVIENGQAIEALGNTATVLRCSPPDV